MPERQDKTRQITHPPGHTKQRTRLLEALFLLDSGLISGVFTPAQGLFLSGDCTYAANIEHGVLGHKRTNRDKRDDEESRSRGTHVTRGHTFVSQVRHVLV
jgi:hypothetical protein